jgi:hypothetical protein
MFEAQMSHTMAPWIQNMRKKAQVLLLKESLQVLSYQDRSRAATTCKEFKVSRTPHLFTNCSGDSKKCISHLLKQVEARLPRQTIESVLIVFLDIRSASVVKTIIDTEIYEKAFEQFVARVLEVRQKIAEKRAPCAFTESPADNPANHQDQHQDDGA